MFHLFVDSSVERLPRMEAIVNIMQAGCFKIEKKDWKACQLVRIFLVASEDDVMKLNYCSVLIVKSWLRSNDKAANFISTQFISIAIIKQSVSRQKSFHHKW